MIEIDYVPLKAFGAPLVKPEKRDCCYRVQLNQMTATGMLAHSDSICNLYNDIFCMFLTLVMGICHFVQAELTINLC